MNYLAHATLSGKEPEILIGNLIADVVRIYNRDGLAPGVSAGIRLHQRIDQFTDDHTAFRRSVSRIWKQYRHYSTAITDVFYDHLLANNFEHFTGESLTDFVGWVNGVLAEHRSAVPSAFYQRFKDVSWLESYADMSGIHRSLRRLSRRSRFGMDFTPAVEDLEVQYDLFEADFFAFFPEVMAFAKFCNAGRRVALTA